MNFSKKKCNYLWGILDDQFQNIKNDWIDKLSWLAPHKAQVINGEGIKGKRNNQHIVDITHILSHRSFVAGFMEGNTSSTRDWFKLAHPDPELNRYEPVKEYIQNLARRALSIGTSSNLYHALSYAYFDYGIVDTSVLYIDELPKGPHFTVLDPGTYRLMNDNMGVANELLREFTMTVKNVVETFGTKKNGEWDWSNFSDLVKRSYEDGDYTTEVIIRERICRNEYFDINKSEAGSNRKWVKLFWEVGRASTVTSSVTRDIYSNPYRDNSLEDDKFLKVSYRTRKPFIAFRNQTTNNFAYGQVGPTTDCLGLIKSLNKKAIGKDVALDFMLKPAVQGPAALKKNYKNIVPGSYHALDPNSYQQGGAKQLFEVNPAIATLNADVADLRSMVGKCYYEDYMLFLAKNPKTRTAAEVNAIVQEQQLVIGPMLQSLDTTLNNPLVDFLADYAIYEDPYIGEAPPELVGQSLKTIFISVFAQSQRAADLPSIERYIAMVSQVGQINQGILDKVNFDKLADLYEDRLYLPAGLNRNQKDVDARREQNMAEAKRQQALQETIPALAKSAKDLSQSEQAGGTGQQQISNLAGQQVPQG